MVGGNGKISEAQKVMKYANLAQQPAGNRMPMKSESTVDLKEIKPIEAPRPVIKPSVTGPESEDASK